MSDEIELKLSLPRAALPRLRKHPLIAGAPRDGNAVTLENTYYDTADLSLHAQRIGLRTRRHGRTWLQTVKCAGTSTGGLTQRPEWERPFDGAFDFSEIDAPKVQKRLHRVEAELAPVFTTRFRRETRVIEPGDGTRILLMIDTGEIVAGEHSEPICEVELELDQGRPVDLLVLACRLAADLPLFPGDESKAERGYRLHLGTPVEPVRAEDSAIDAGQSPVEAFRTLAQSCVRQWQANALAAASHDDPEFIHQLRISQRRLRSLLRLFAPALPADFVADWSDRLRMNAASFGDARDLDVLCDEILAPVAATTDAEGVALERLLGVVAEAREKARAEVAHRLDAAAQGRLLIGFMAALHALPTDSLIGSARLRTFARLQLEGLRKKVRKRLRAAHDMKPAHLHGLRITLKKLRYALEFFLPLMPRKEAARYLRTVARTQSALGFVNDIDVARTTLLGQAGDDPELRGAAAFVFGWHAPRYKRLGTRAVRDLDALLGGPNPWG